MKSQLHPLSVEAERALKSRVFWGDDLESACRALFELVATGLPIDFLGISVLDANRGTVDYKVFAT